jgi:hypothetical protein
MYSVDKDSNKENPFTPSPDLPLREQFLYRFSALEEAVRSGFRRLDERMDRIQTEIHDRQLEVNTRLNDIEKDFRENLAFKRARIDKLEMRISELETWSKVVTARFAVILAVVTVVWTLIAPVLRNMIGVPS